MFKTKYTGSIYCVIQAEYTGSIYCVIQVECTGSVIQAERELKMEEEESKTQEGRKVGRERGR